MVDHDRHDATAKDLAEVLLLLGLVREGQYLLVASQLLEEVIHVNGFIDTISLVGVEVDDELFDVLNDVVDAILVVVGGIDTIHQYRLFITKHPLSSRCQ